MKKYTFYIIAILFVFQACSKPKPISRQGLKYVDIQVDVYSERIISESQIKDNYIVKLETNDECLIGDIRKLSVENDRIFILDSDVSQKLFVFNKTGKYLFSIGQKGQGPGEYYSINDFFIDKDDRRIIIYDANLRNLHYYDWDGQYVKTHSFSGKWLFACCPIDSNLFALDFNKKALANKYHLEFVDVNNDVQAAFKPLEMDYELANNFHIAFYRGIDNKVLYVPTRCDTIFDISNGVLSGGYYVDFGANKVPIDRHKKLKKRDQVIDLLNSKYCYGIKNVLETSNMLYFDFSFGSNGFPLFYDRNSKLTYSGLLYFPLPKAVDSDNYFVGFYESYVVNQIVSSPDSYDYNVNWRKSIGETSWKVVEQMKPSDNPLLLFYKIEL